MKQLISIVVITLLLTSNCLSRSITSEPDNSFVAGSGNSVVTYDQPRDWVKISSAPPARVTQVRGTSIELECVVMGSPTPIVQWVHGSGQMIDMDDFETNVITESSPNAIARVQSRIILDHSKASERTYTCIGRAGGQSDYSSTVVHMTSATKQENLTENLSLNNVFGGLKKARITLNYETIFDTIGTNLIVPCQAVGRPLPEIYWLDDNNNVITGQDPRFKTLPTGELIISNLRWMDMGTYTCVAKNALAKDSTQTFIYPVKEE